MPSGHRRYYRNHDVHFITCSCYHRRAVLGAASSRDLFLRILEETRFQYQFVVLGYVAMPEHFHLLVSEPERETPSTVMQVLKQRFAREFHKFTNPALSQTARKDGAPATVQFSQSPRERGFPFRLGERASVAAR